ncbi:hypothetical protein PanWU01x14_005280 [Parasponia andersonii]|uniref:Uncharacterized protein n=1 Tax=Parasponia andersonii TaxID=3476 RepID=A0A2P5E3G5_PARAD|nr:hypothetical protein PanWU01x14_005280 [Parasponia andersonii]
MVMLLFHFWDNEDEPSNTSTGPSYTGTVIMVQLDKQISVEGSEKCLKQLLLEDWKRVDKESLVNFKYNKLEENSAVVKILVVAQGVHEIPSIITHESLNEVLQSLSSISLDEAVVPIF